jgi:hypothetical protein
MEILNELQNPVLVAATMGIVQLIKDKGIFKKLPTRLVSFVLALILLILSNISNLSLEVLVTIEGVLVIILPALGFDYLVDPVLKNVFGVFKEKAPTK